MARIIAVADVFEALTSDRPYRKRMSVEKAVSILREESGETLDPTLVETFLDQVLPQIEAKLRAADSEQAAAESPGKSDVSAASAPSQVTV